MTEVSEISKEKGETGGQGMYDKYVKTTRDSEASVALPTLDPGPVSHQ